MSTLASLQPKRGISNNISPLEIDVTKDLNKSIMVLLDTASTCNKPLKKIAQSLIPLEHTMKNYLTHSKATL